MALVLRSDNDLTKMVMPTGATYTYVYDNYHNVKTATSAEGLVYNFTYDAYGNNTQVSISGTGGTISSSAAYSNSGNTLASTTDALGKVTTYGYNAQTNVLEWVQYPKDKDTNRKTAYTYDEMYRIATAEATTDTGLNLSATYTYDNDLLTKIQTPTTTYNFTYGNFGLRNAVKVGTQTLATYTYTDDRNFYLQSLDYGNGDSVDYTYDSQGRLTSQTYEDGDTVTYQYDNDGALAVVVDSATGITKKYYYDFTGRTMKYTESASGYSHSVGYDYDDINNLISQVETINGTTHTTSYTYDKDNRVKSKTTDGITVSYTYDALGRVTQQVTKNGSTPILTESYTYKENSSQVASYSTTVNGTTLTYEYTYDDNGNILSETKSGFVTEYIYDSANQLLEERNEAGERLWIWSYDNAGNILSQEAYDYAQAIKTDQLSSVSYTYGNEQWGDLLTSYDGDPIVYDEIGNPLDNCTWEYTWEHGRELSSMSNGIDTWTYTYNADGIRTKRTNGTRTYEYFYNGSQLVQLKVDGNTLFFTYDAQGVPATVNYNGTVYYYITNLQGDVTSIVDANGTAQVVCTYNAYGLRGHSTGNLNSGIGLYNPFWYRGYVYDQETRLYYLQSRYYDPEIGRFINADGLMTTGQGFIGNNMFAYCLNNPVNFVDYNGEEPESILAWWSGGMSWLCLADTVLPIGDILYGVGVVTLTLVVVITNTGSTVSTPDQYEVSDSTNSSSDGQSGTTTASGAASPKPPKKTSGISFSKLFKADTTYNKNGVRVDYEYNGNGTGNVHMHKNGIKYHYDSQGYFKMGPGDSAPRAPGSIQRLLRDKAILDAIMKGLRIIRELGGF